MAILKELTTNQWKKIKAKVCEAPRNNKTYVRYFLSYFLIFSTLMVCFFLVLRLDLSGRYREQLSKNALIQIDSLSTEFASNFNYLSQVHSAVTSDVQFGTVRYNTSGYANYSFFNLLKKLDTANELINAICYINKDSGEVLSTQYGISYSPNNWLEIRNTSSDKNITFCLDTYLDNASAQFLSLSNEKTNYLIFFPAQRNDSNYLLLYFIDTSILQQRMQSVSSDTMPAIALVDQASNVITAVNPEQLIDHLPSIDLTAQTYELGHASSINISPIKICQFYIVSLISGKTLEQQLNIAFATSYLLLLALSFVGFVLVRCGMKTTYMPLHRLTKKIVPEATGINGYLMQLDDAFENAQYEKQLMEARLHKYQLSVKKSVLDSVLKSNAVSQPIDSIDMDYLFDMDVEKTLYAVMLKPFDLSLTSNDIQDFFQNILPEGSFCTLVSQEKDISLFLISYTGSSEKKESHMLALLNTLYRDYQCLAAISNGSSSPMSIPSLCENVIYASKYWMQDSVVAYTSLPAVHKNFSYPKKQLDSLGKMLHENSFADAEHQAEEIFAILNHATSVNNPLPDFFMRSILIDMVTLIVGYMNSAHIDYSSYEDIYYETLYFCRSCPYQDKSDNIASNIRMLLRICTQNANTQITPLRLKQLIEESCYNPDFSIYVLADKLNISFTYASNLIKKELNQNFSDYLWTLRFEKAKDLLTQTNMTVNEISISVGYINVSSFIRKFKRETNSTPSEFRAQAVTNKENT